MGCSKISSAGEGRGHNCRLKAKAGYVLTGMCGASRVPERKRREMGLGLGSDQIVKSLWLGETRKKGATSLLTELSIPALRVPSAGRRRGEVGRGSGAWILALALPLHHAISLGLRSLPYKMGMNKKNSSYHSLSHRSMPGTFLNLTDNCCTKSS